tara:strand:+ start:3870 stop:4466 length:597 start_codon:yes stop_codon:yes gene_type:complete
MIRLACSVPRKVVLACSGGRDSMSVLEFLVRGRREVTVAYFNHATPHGEDAEIFLREFCDRQKLSLVCGYYTNKNKTKKPTESTWRTARYQFLSQFNDPVITAHHLDDVVEWWIFSSMRGNPNLIPIQREDVNVIRPFLLSRQRELHKKFREYPHIEDPSNKETVHTRNFIRHEIVPKVLKINPGLHNTIKNLYSSSE